MELPVAQNDAVGGAGSFGNIGSAVLDVLVYGAKSTIDGRNARKYGYSDFDNPLAITAEGKARPAAAPAKTKTFGESAAELFSNPIVMVGGAAVVLVTVLVLVLKK